MNTGPNAFQRSLHRFLVLRPVTALFAPRAHRVDQAILKLSNGKHTVSELLGWNIVQLTTIGAKTAKPRIVPVIGLFDLERIALIASNFGRAYNPGWYYNLKANPECEVQISGESRHYKASEASGDEYAKYWELAVWYYAGYEKYKERAGRKIPVMVLEPKS